MLLDDRLIIFIRFTVLAQIFTIAAIRVHHPETGLLFIAGLEDNAPPNMLSGRGVGVGVGAAWAEWE